MATSVLGKRSRRAITSESLVPAKRARKAAQLDIFGEATIADNIEVLEVIDENQENQPPASTIREIAVPKTPSARRTQDVKPAKTKAKSTYIPVTPQTPRSYDALAKSVSTPRQRVMSAGKLSKRLTPQTPSTPSSCQTIYHRARQLFSRSTESGQLIGRDEERARLGDFLARCSSPQPSGCMYVSGPPGTGKSAMVTEVTEGVAQSVAHIKKAHINCMSIKSSKDLYAILLQQLSDTEGIETERAVEILQKLFISKKRSADVFVVILDEIDHILSLDLESLYRVFEWSMQKSSRLVLVGIANALDLTDRFLPRLKSRNLKPELLPFLPYTAPQIKTIIITRLKTLLPEGAAALGAPPLMHPAAIELCSRKVASQTGDLRKAFEICRRSLDLVELETRQKHEQELKDKHFQMTPSRKVLGENANLARASTTFSSPERSFSADVVKLLQSLTAETAPRVSIGHLNKITLAAFSNGSNQRLKTLNLQQKAALCALIALEKRNRTANDVGVSIGTPSKSRVTVPTVKVLFDTYCVLCTRDSVLHPLSSSEFREVIGSLETLSLITPVDGKTGSFALAAQTPSKRGRKPAFAKANGIGDDMKVASCIGEKEVSGAAEGLGADILHSILSGQALD